MQKLLIIGGCGRVGSLVLPYLSESFDLTIFDLRRPASDRWRYIEGNITDLSAVQRAMARQDLLLFMAMPPVPYGGIEQVASAYDINAKGVHLAMEAAAGAGIKRAVYTSTLSVHDGADLTTGQFDSEEAPPEPRSIYGHTKWIGELACQYVNRMTGLPIVALRLFLPVSQEEWIEKHDADASMVDPRTSAPDLAVAIEAALLLEQSGFEVIQVTGDTTGRAFRHEKAKRLLGWEPREGA